MELIEKLADVYFDFANTNFQRYQMMFVTNPPGKKEKNSEIDFDPGTTDVLVQILNKAIEEGEIQPVDTEKYALYLWSIVHGATLVVNSDLFKQRTKRAHSGTKKEFQEFVKKQFREQWKTQLQNIPMKN